MKKTKIVIQVLLISIIVFCILLLPSVIFHTSVTKFILTKISFVTPLIVLSFILSFILTKSRIAGIIVILSFVLFISLISILIENIENEYEEKVVWNSTEDSFTTDFIVGKQGLFYLKAQINGATGLFLFDTGCSLTSVSEKYISNENIKLKPYTITDVNGIKQTKHTFMVKWFELGDMGIERLKVYPSDTLSMTSPNGVHFKQDRILGIIGNNIISKFIWDFDLIKRRVTISNNKDYCNSISDSLAINLVSRNTHKEIPVQINSEDKLLILDFGCSSPIVISESIPNRNVLNKNMGTFSGERSKGALSHLDSINGVRDNSGGFIDIKLGNYKFKKIKCIKNDHVDLLGIPFVWSFERVVLDFSNNKSYFISDNFTSSEFGVKKHNWQSIVNKSKIMTLYAKPNGTLIKMEKDSMEVRYVVFGLTKLYKNNGGLDSIFCQDSIHMPNGQTINGPITMKLN